MTKILVLMVATMLAALALPARADISTGTPTFDWSQPTQWSDGSTLTVSQITGYQLSCTGAATVSRRIATATGVPPSVTLAANRFAPGAYTCTLAVFAKLTPTSTEVLGGASNGASFTVPQPTPGAATGFSAN